MRKVSVTELAKLGKCERQAYYDHLYGTEHEKVRAAAEQGREEHLRFAERLSGKADHRGIDFPGDTFTDGQTDRHGA